MNESFMFIKENSRTDKDKGIYLRDTACKYAYW